MVQPPRRQPMPQQSHSMAEVHSQSVIHREREAPQAQMEEPQQPPENAQSTWVIEEVIDFGLPLDEGMVRECDDSGHPFGCKIGPPQRGNVNLFDGCVQNLCYDEQQGIEVNERADNTREFC